MGKIMVKGVMYGGGDCANQNLASEFSESSTYAVDDYVIYQDDLYKCTTAVSTAGSWDNTKWTRAQITDEMGGSSVSALEDLTDVDITNPAANDTIKWNPTTQKWENGGGGGTGDVADVYVNGQSVLDANKIAQIKSYKEVTQAEYDALPASKESDDVLYCITDKATADTTVAPIIYSEEEREVGVWTDGKPLYQKTLSVTTPSTTGSGVEVINLANLSIDTFINLTGNLYCVSMQQYIPIQFPYNAQLLIATYYEGTYIRQTIGTSTYANCPEFITIQYTKTTDTPGSGKYAPSGVPAVHYSENEQVVGTWIDGNTIYERTITGNVNLTTTSRTWYQLISAADVTNIWKANKMWVTDASYIIDPGDSTIYTIPSNTGSAYVAAMKVDDGAFKLVAANISTGNAEYAITIRYTKTS